MVLADTLSWTYIDDDDDISKSLEEDLVCAVNFKLNKTPVSDPKLDELRAATKTDTTMNNLKKVMARFHNG